MVSVEPMPVSQNVDEIILELMSRHNSLRMHVLHSQNVQGSSSWRMKSWTVLNKTW